MIINDLFNTLTNVKFTLTRLYVLIQSLIILSLIGCNFPGNKATHLSDADQRKTEISWILNPTVVNAPQILPTVTPAPPEPVQLPSAPIEFVDGTIVYTTQQGDTLPALANRFNVSIEAILSEVPASNEGLLLPIGIKIQIPDVIETFLPYTSPILPDSEVVWGPGVGDFDTIAYAAAAGGFLASYSESVQGVILSGPEIVQLVALDTSTNPRLLLAFLEYQSGWVFSHPQNAGNDPYPIGFGATADTGLYKELMITAKLLAQGFYGWRDGSRLNLTFFGGGGERLSPGLNAGSTALMHLFAVIYTREAWETRLFGTGSFLDKYKEMFGDYWGRAGSVEPYLLNTTWQPDLTLPFAIGERWSLTGGPHIAWQTGTPRGAVDFAPITGESACAVSTHWVTAPAPGRVVRSSRGLLALDLDGDGDEGSGWVLIFLHIAEKERAPLGAWLDQDSRVGHPSCEGGQASGTHTHVARKFNGEWLGVGEPLPLVLSGWRAFAGVGRYEGFLQKGDKIVTNRPDGSSGSTIIRED